MKLKTMTPFRLLLAGFALISLLVIGALAWQANRAMQQEQLLLHQVIAQDLFDNIETQLALIIRDEETRPFNHYSYYYISDQQVLNNTQVLMCSPIADISGNKLITGYFQVDPQRQLSFPHKVNDANAVSKVTAGQPQTFQQEPKLRAALEKTNLLDGFDVSVLPQKNKDASNWVVQNGMEQQMEAVNPELLKSRSNRSQFTRDYNITSQTSIGNSAYSYHNDNKIDLGKTGTLDLDIKQFRSIPVDEHVTIFVRDVVIGDNADNKYYQGFLLNNQVLHQQVDAQLGKAFPIEDDWTLRWLSGDHERQAKQLHVADDHYGFYHQLDDPFGHIGLFLEMPPHVAGIGTSEKTFFIVTISLAGFMIIGLWLIDRMVLVRQRFTERRQNFVAAVSHELKTPLTAIRMHAEMLEAKMVPDESKQHDYYKTIHAESQRLSRLIDNVLTLSRLEQDSLELNLEIGSIAPVLRSAVDMLRPHAEQQGFKLVCDISESELPPVRFERDALTQVILNCIDNGLKFSQDAEQKEIIISLLPSESGVDLRIRDNGPGVASEQCAHIFEAFYRGEGELTRRTKGTGIGLALVRQLAAAMHVGVQARNHEQGGFEIAFSFQTA